MKVHNSESASRVKLPFGCKIGFMRLFGRGEITQRDGFTVNVDARPPLPMVGVDAHVTASAPTLAPVMDIPLPRALAEVSDPVVITDAVDVVNFSIRPNAVYVQPCEAMCSVVLKVDLDASIAEAVKASSLFATQRTVRGLPPRKNPGVRVIIQKIAQAFCGKVGLSHVVAPIKRWFGQRPGIAENGVGLRIYSMGGI